MNIHTNKATSVLQTTGLPFDFFGCIPPPPIPSPPTANVGVPPWTTVPEVAAVGAAYALVRRKPSIMVPDAAAVLVTPGRPVPEGMTTTPPPGALVAWSSGLACAIATTSSSRSKTTYAERRKESPRMLVSSMTMLKPKKSHAPDGSVKCSAEYTWGPMSCEKGTWTVGPSWPPKV